MPESSLHQTLVQELVSHLRSEHPGIVIEAVAGDGRYPDPPRVGRHEPDVIARWSRGELWIGEAKTGNGDLETPHTLEQIDDFQRHADHFLLLVPRAFGDQAIETVRALGLSGWVIVAVA